MCKVHTTHSYWSDRQKKLKINVDELNVNFENLIQDLDKSITNLTNIIEEEKEYESELQRKAIHIAIKHHKTTLEIMSTYGFSDETDLFSAIQTFIPNGSERIISDLRQNDKNFKKHHSRSHAKPEEPSTSLAPEVRPDVPEVIEEVITSDEPDTLAELGDTSNEPSTTSVAKLKEKESELSSLVIRCEMEHKQAIADHQSAVEKYEDSLSVLNELKRLAEKQKVTIEKITAECEEINLRMEEAYAAKKKYSAELSKVRSALDELCKAQVFVYGNCQVEVENTTLPDSIYDDDVIQSKFMDLIRLPAAEESNLSIKEFKTIAKLLILVAYFKANKIKFEVSFDSPEVQIFYETIE